MKKFIMICCLLCSACACEPQAANSNKTNMPVIERENNSATVKEISQEVSIERIGIFEDNLAYGEKRGVYRIIDKKNNIEFLGVSGIGIAATGVHSMGKTLAGDER